MSLKLYYSTKIDLFFLSSLQFEEEIESERPEDPRSPSFGITRTPVAPALESETKALIQKEREDLIQVLNFTDLDCLSLSNIEEDSSLITEEVPEEVPEGVPAPSAEETFDFSSLVIPASSTPAPSPVKQPTSNKTKRPVTNNVVDENSFGKNNSPLSSPNPQKNAPSVRPRVPFGDVNRPALASPRLHLQNKQRHLVRSELLQHQQRYGNKSD